MTPDELLERTLEKAKRAPVGGRVDAAAMARQAAAQAAVDQRIARERRSRFWLGATFSAAAITLLGIVTYASLSDAPAAVSKTEAPPMPLPTAPVDEAPSRTEAPARLRLATGDLLYSSTGARFEVPETVGTRVVELESGDMLFDVVHREGERFAVRAGEVEVEVLGTVFSVLHDDDVVAVRVFDGLVAVRRGDEVHRIGAGEMWASGDSPELGPWRTRSDEQWRAIAPDGVREEGRGAPEEGAEGLSAPSGRTPPTTTDETADEAAAVAADLAEGRRLLRAGEFGALLALPHSDDGAWLLLRGDALRGLRRSAEAADTYERAAAHLSGLRRAQAAFAAAQLRTDTAPQSALSIVASFGLAREGSALEERARALRIRLLRRLGRQTEAQAEANEYERRFGGAP
ncbi:MAG: FecR family protein [Myxococcota bacterium]